MLNIRPCIVANGPPPPSDTVGAGHAMGDTKGLKVAEVIITLALKDKDAYLLLFLTSWRCALEYVYTLGWMCVLESYTL